MTYDFIDNGEGAIMLVMDAQEGKADEEIARFVYDGFDYGMLIRNDSQTIYFADIAEDARNMLNGLKTIQIAEMDGEEISNVYEARVEILAKAARTSGDANFLGSPGVDMRYIDYMEAVEYYKKATEGTQDNDCRIFI